MCACLCVCAPVFVCVRGGWGAAHRPAQSPGPAAAAPVAPCSPGGWSDTARGCRSARRAGARAPPRSRRPSPPRRRCSLFQAWCGRGLCGQSLRPGRRQGIGGCGLADDRWEAGLLRRAPRPRGTGPRPAAAVAAAEAAPARRSLAPRGAARAPSVLVATKKQPGSSRRLQVRGRRGAGGVACVLRTVRRSPPLRACAALSPLRGGARPAGAPRRPRARTYVR